MAASKTYFIMARQTAITLVICLPLLQMTQFLYVFFMHSCTTTLVVWTLFQDMYKSQEEWWSYHLLKFACHEYDWIIKTSHDIFIRQFGLHEEFHGRIIQITSESKYKV